jgi:hypothetical protein
MGDLDLRAEIHLDDHNSVVYRRDRQACARRIYSARIPGVDSKMTVAVYQGNNAEKVCFRWHSTESEVIILFGRNGGSMFNGIRGFGGSVLRATTPRLQFQK